MGFFDLFDKYYFVSSKDISKAIWIENSYGMKFIDRVFSSNFFLENGIPDKYQKIVIVVPLWQTIKSRMSDNAATKLNSFFGNEYISGFSFCKIPQSNVDRVHLTNVTFQGYIDLITIDSKISVTSKTEVDQFINELKSRNLIEGYLNALVQLFDKSSAAVVNIELKREEYSTGEKDKMNVKRIGYF